MLDKKNTENEKQIDFQSLFCVGQRKNEIKYRNNKYITQSVDRNWVSLPENENFDIDSKDKLNFTRLNNNIQYFSIGVSQHGLKYMEKLESKNSTR